MNIDFYPKSNVWPCRALQLEQFLAWKYFDIVNIHEVMIFTRTAIEGNVLYLYLSM